MPGISRLHPSRKEKICFVENVVPKCLILLAFVRNAAHLCPPVPNGQEGNRIHPIPNGQELSQLILAPKGQTLRVFSKIPSLRTTTTRIHCQEPRKTRRKSWWASPSWLRLP